MMQLVPIVWNAQNISEITGSISIACWVIVFVPQLYENFKRQSAEGLSLLFVVLWLAGDVFNLLGSLLQHLLPTMIILAAYYTIADILLLLQCLWYGTEVEENLNLINFSPANPISENVLQDVFNEQQPLLISHNDGHATDDGVGLRNNRNINVSMQYSSISEVIEDEQAFKKEKQNVISDALIVTTVVFGGFLVWYIQYCSKYSDGGNNGGDIEKPALELNMLAQFFGYLSAALYLGSRVPQILLNYQRKSCEGVSFLFFLFACLGNTTFIVSVLSISLDSFYILVNLSWILGSSGTLIMDFIIFIQFFYYKKNSTDSKNTNVHNENDIQQLA
ncbi:hypothetical protein TPHA_0A04550 [Tetrapisispora phaffii CBS 4417]|uniref:PQ-loop repeat-containing protein n=1 Tax=Tetrapisispora phaffii (strain ATCC 24235 / CBS 4417 / NBRC 1672 / NRRL Y-8282 / UCD 70-5) TaxID=1071381 RepID=G8BNQ0_TETPH|nr:hypothetical protein TPHA_0A04550 [Tetrapisispora phaffii CBS 4417]CCE61528.1 hypothetical protein TPHA_0A04550 [Tetrapisispora phaffii CBS 4417]